MIQRKQTLFLLISFGLIISMFFSTMAYSSSEKLTFMHKTEFLILNIIITFLTFFAIFTYRHRILQIRISAMNTAMLIGYQCWIAWFFFTRPHESVFTVSAVFPIVCAILTILAIRYIAIDEARVRSTSRLRK